MMDANAGSYGRGDAPEVSKLRASEAHLLELRKIHSMLHSAMDALIKDLNANEAARLLILMDDRLTSLINTADVESGEETASSDNAEGPSPAAQTKVPPTTHMKIETEAPERAAIVDRPPPQRRQTPPPASVPVEPSAKPKAGERPVESQPVPNEPILSAPPAAEPARAPQAQVPSFEALIASAAKAGLAAPKPAQPEPSPAIEAAPEASAMAPKPADAPRPTDEQLVEAVPDIAPVAADEEIAEPRDDEPEWIEEDFEDGADLREELEAASPKQGLAGRLLSRFRMPGLGRRPATAVGNVEQSATVDEPEEAFTGEEKAAFEEVSALPPARAPAIDPKVRRLHLVADQLQSDQLLDEAAHRTGNRIELRKVDLGLDLVVKGLPKPLGTVRIAEMAGHVLYQPGFGLDLPNREPNRADLEIWMKAMGDMVVRVLQDIARRRKTDGEPGADDGRASG